MKPYFAVKPRRQTITNQLGNQPAVELLGPGLQFVINFQANDNVNDTHFP